MPKCIGHCFSFIQFLCIIYYRQCVITLEPMNQKLLTTAIQRLFLLIIFTLLGCMDIQSATIFGADITYKSKGNYTYQVTLNYYRYCDADSFGLPQKLDIMCGANGASNSILSHLGQKTIKDITPYNDTTTKRCNQNSPNAAKAVERHRWVFELNLNDSFYQNYKNCDSFFITTSFCCRDTNINTGAQGRDYFTFAYINLKYAPNNNSAEMLTDPRLQLCCNEPVYYNMGGIDTADYDSISFSLAHPLSGWGNNIGYYNPNSNLLAYYHPFTVYLPGTLGSRHPIPAFPNGLAGNPTPIGLFYSRESGDFIFTPVSCNEKTVAVMEIKEFRRVSIIDTLGDTVLVMKHIGTVRRDLQYNVDTCAGNFSPTIHSRFRNVICENEKLCLDIETDDRRYINPSTGALGTLDTVRLTHSSTISNASWRIKDSAARLQTAEFCWTPKIGDARDVPYRFTIQAREGAGVLNSVSSMAVLILVKMRSEAQTVIKPLDCGIWSLECVPDERLRGDLKYQWQIFDTSGNQITNPRTLNFINRKTTVSSRKLDTLEFKKEGTYIIRHGINNFPYDCPSYYYDTVQVKLTAEMQLTVENDTFTCEGIPITLMPKWKSSYIPIAYQWGTKETLPNGQFDDTTMVLNPADTFSYFNLTLFQHTYDTAVYVEITDSNGCIMTDEIRVFQRENPKIFLPTPPRLCVGEQYVAKPKFDKAVFYNKYLKKNFSTGSELVKTWMYDNDLIGTSDTLILESPGWYMTQIVDSFGCSDVDSILLQINDTIHINTGGSREICFGDMVQLNPSGLDTFDNNKKGFYEWFDITNSTITSLGKKGEQQYNAINTQNLKLVIQEEQEGLACRVEDTISIDVNPLPDIKIEKQIELCENMGDVILMQYNINPKFSSDYGLWSHTSMPILLAQNAFKTDYAVHGNYYVQYRLIDSFTGCKNIDSMKIVVNPKPDVSLKSKDICQSQKQIELTSGNLADRIVQMPFNVNVGRQSWKCLKCNGNDFNRILEDVSPTDFQRYVLNIDTNYYTIKSPDGIDTMILEFTFLNKLGCLSRDTVPIRITKLFNKSIKTDLSTCFNSGIVSLNELSNIPYSGGLWFLVDSIGFLQPGKLGTEIKNSPFVNQYNIVKPDKIDVGISEKIESNPNSSSSYLLRYSNVINGCSIDINPILTIYSKTKVTITQPFEYRRKFCETLESVELKTFPSIISGTWTSNDSTGLSGNIFSPKLSHLRNEPIHLNFNSVNQNNCKDTVSITVVVKPKPNLMVDDQLVLCKYLDIEEQSIVFSGNVDGDNEIKWTSNRPNDIDFIPIDNNSVEIIHRGENLKDTVLIISYVEQIDPMECPYEEKISNMIIQPFGLSTTILGAELVNIQDEHTYWIKHHNNNKTYNWDIKGGVITQSMDSVIKVRWTELGLQRLILNIEDNKNCMDEITYDVEVKSELGLDLISKTFLKVYPTITKNKVYIEGQYDFCEVYALSGKSLFRSESNQSELELAYLADGMYLISIFQNGIKSNFRVIVMK